MKQMTMKEKLARIAALPNGILSPSGHYWCATCKKFFRLDEPTCPYMTNMCINNVLPVEVFAPPHPIAYERFGLFYPKFPQRALARLVEGVPQAQLTELGEALSVAYLDELTEWHVQSRHDPVETLKSFVIFTSGCEVAQRKLEDTLLLIVLDPQNVWTEQPRLRNVLEGALAHLRESLHIETPVTLDFIRIVPGPLGRYFCPKCRMYFEFGVARENVICPLMPQKCMFKPTAVKGPYPLADLLKIYRVTPRLYARLIEATLPFSETPAEQVIQSLDQEVRDWGFEGEATEWNALHAALGLG